MSKYGSRKSIDLEWIERWARRVNEDRVMPKLGRFFNARFVLGVDDVDYLLHMREGKVAKISEGLEPSDFGYEFALRAPSSAWSKFSQKTPPPMFNDIWAMAHPLHKQLRIEGNQLTFWQNMRAMHWMLSLMREV
ncbi:hypothetical protein ABMA32_03925 [Mesorhizobium sp. VNQ89]|jgi:hypothetical protein|uniref:hypothetical protein n=1 Tax=Mesorhizobium quangtriensis TaxID=3157709 RepID=UPI001A63C862|nr:hypothetical protein [Mesorhizobium sp.]MBL8580309.1 hypothetical protein [Mesorhizobium sp.]MBX3582268.1 hypothetical protein [Rhizobiaceae bacterium]